MEEDKRMATKGDKTTRKEGGNREQRPTGLVISLPRSDA